MGTGLRITPSSRNMGTDMKKLLVTIALILSLSTFAESACHTLGCYKFQILGQWQVDTAQRTNKIAPAEQFKMECWTIRPDVAVKNPNAEVWECTADETTYNAIDADPNFSMLYSEQKVIENYCTDPLYVSQATCEAQDCYQADGATYCYPPHGAWLQREVWQ